jgi:hypothetical protein
MQSRTPGIEVDLVQPCKFGAHLGLFGGLEVDQTQLEVAREWT